jgi:TRAP-type C4-dicarboxylate transport system permease large subunit
VAPVLGGIFAVVIGGIYFGFFNPTPAAAVGVFLVTVLRASRRGLSCAAGAVPGGAARYREDRPA